MNRDISWTFCKTVRYCSKPEQNQLLRKEASLLGAAEPETNPWTKRLSQFWNHNFFLTNQRTPLMFPSCFVNICSFLCSLILLRMTCHSDINHLFQLSELFDRLSEAKMPPSGKYKILYRSASLSHFPFGRKQIYIHPSSPVSTPLPRILTKI